MEVRRERSEKVRVRVSRKNLQAILVECQSAIELLDSISGVDEDEARVADGRLLEGSLCTGDDPEADQLCDLLKSGFECPAFLEKLECAQASILHDTTEDGSFWDMVNKDDLWKGEDIDSDQEDYVLIKQEDIMDGIACFMAAYMLSLKQIKDLTPNQLQEALSKTFSVKKKGKLQKAWDGSKVVYNVASWEATANGENVMRKKRKGSEADASSNLPEILTSNHGNHGSLSSNLKSHYSLEDCSRLKKRCKEDADAEPIAPCNNKLAGFATAPPCGTSSLLTPVRGLKRKIGCIDVATQMGRRKKIEDDYVSGETIGQGKFGSVWLCRSRLSGAEYACKTLQKGEETVHQEVEIMQHLSGHPGVVTLLSVYEEAECFHLVMELCSGGRLIDRMVKEGPYTEQRAANVLKEVVLVIKYCHDMGVVHRDVKPENILLTASGKLKLADFGLAMRISDGQNLTGLAGSPAYVAPEVLSGSYSEKVDIWSAGVLLHAMLIGVLPFQGNSLEAVFEAIKNVKLDFHKGMWEAISKPARDLLGRMLTRDVSARITADEVLRHPWILFYTEPTLESLPMKTKMKFGASCRQFVAPELGSRRNGINDDASVSSPLSSSESCNSEDWDDCVLMDVLTSAISHVRISEPKRSRLCSPTDPIDQRGSSNMTTSNLCKAF